MTDFAIATREQSSLTCMTLYDAIRNRIIHEKATTKKKEKVKKNADRTDNWTQIADLTA